MISAKPCSWEQRAFFALFSFIGLLWACVPFASSETDEVVEVSYVDNAVRAGYVETECPRDPNRVPFTCDGVTTMRLRVIVPEKGKAATDGLTQAKKDSVAVQCELAKARNGWNEKDKSDCYTLLLAIAWHESGFRETAVGDGGQSHGAFQIYRKAHPDVSVEDAKDWDFAVSWTLNRLVEYGFPRDQYRATLAHNGFGGDGSYPRAVLATKAKFEKQGL